MSCIFFPQIPPSYHSAICFGRGLVMVSQPNLMQMRNSVETMARRTQLWRPSLSHSGSSNSWNVSLDANKRLQQKREKPSVILICCYTFFNVPVPPLSQFSIKIQFTHIRHKIDKETICNSEESNGTQGNVTCVVYWVWEPQGTQQI